MALEDLTGTNKYIANLVNTNPLSADDRREGDDHIRGIKNVLLNTFGALSAPVDLGAYVKKAGDAMTGALTNTSSFTGSAGTFGNVLVGENATDRYASFSGGNYSWNWNKATGVMHWLGVGGAQLFRIDTTGTAFAAGSVWAGATSNFGLTRSGGFRYHAFDTGWVWRYTEANGTIELFRNNVVGLSIYSGGFIVTYGDAQKPGGGPWTAFSDSRLKDRIADFTDGLAVLKRLRPRTYHYKEAALPGESGRQFVGLIADEAERVFPRLVKRAKGKMGEIELADLATMDTGALTYCLINAVKTLAARVEALEILCAGRAGDAPV